MTTSILVVQRKERNSLHSTDKRSNGVVLRTHIAQICFNSECEFQNLCYVRELCISGCVLCPSHRSIFSIAMQAHLWTWGWGESSLGQVLRQSSVMFIWMEVPWAQKFLVEENTCPKSMRNHKENVYWDPIRSEYVCNQGTGNTDIWRNPWRICNNQTSSHNAIWRFISLILNTLRKEQWENIECLHII